MNVLIADSRISAAPLLAGELRTRNVSVTLAVPEKTAAIKPEKPDKGPRLTETAWNPLSWLSSESLLFEASAQEDLDALVLCFDLKDFAAEFSKSPFAGIFGTSVAAFQTLLDGAVKRFQKQKGGRIVFVHQTTSEEQAKGLPLSPMQLIAAESAESAFVRCAEETAAVFARPEESAIRVTLLRTPFEIPWAVNHILDTKPTRNSGKWISQSSGLPIFPRRI